MCLVCASFNPFLEHCEYEGLPGAAPGGGVPMAPQGLTLREVGDAASSTGTAATIGVNDSFLGTLSRSNDVDWIRVNLVAGQEYTVAVTGTGPLGVSNDDPYLRIRDASGAQIAFDDDDGPGRYSAHTFTASYSGSHYIDVQSWNNSDSGSYGVSVTEGDRASFSAEMGAGTLLRPDAAWTSTPGGGATISWSIRASGTEPSGGNPFVSPSASQIGGIQDAMAYLDALSGLTFIQVAPGGSSNNATIRFGSYSAFDGAGAYAYYPGSIAFNSNAGDIWINNTSATTGPFSFGSYTSFLLLHEIGHAVGLAHPGDYNAGGGGPITYANSAQFMQDSHQYTVMSYFDETFTGVSSGLGYPDTFMLYDLLAIHELYGANTGYQAGNTTYGFNATNTGTAYDFTVNTTPFLSIYDGSGNDTIDLSGYSMAQRLNLTEGSFSNVGGYTANLSIAFGAVIETALGGAGNDTITGNAANNWIDGNGGRDTFVIGLNRSDVTVTEVSDGYRLVSALGTDTLTEIEFVQFNDQLLDLSTVVNPGGATSGNDTLYGSAGNDAIDLLDGNDVYWAGAGNDTIEGGLGSDVLIGETGDDTYIMSDSRPGDFDQILDGDGNHDIADFSGLSSAILVDLRNKGEAVSTNDLSSAVAGGTFRVIAELRGIEHIDGTHFNDLIVGEGSSSGLDGMLGSDTIIGGFGDDYYRISVSRPGDYDQLLDADGHNDFGDLAEFGAAVRVNMVDKANAIQTNDTAIAQGGTFRVMADMRGIENFRGTAFSDLIVGEGSANRLEGGAGNDTIDGAGNNDVLVGQAGSDTFVFADGHGRDVILDFDARDSNEKIDLAGVSRIQSWSDLLGGRMQQEGADAVIDTGTGNLRLKNVSLADLGADDFRFTAAQGPVGFEAERSAGIVDKPEYTLETPVVEPIVQDATSRFADMDPLPDPVSLGLGSWDDALL